MKKLTAIALCAGLALAGCAQLASPQTTQALANLKTGATLLVCAVANASSVATQIEAAVNAGNALQGTTGKVYVASSIVCDSLGGTVVGKTVVK